jgi:hypothetical protein
VVLADDDGLTVVTAAPAGLMPGGLCILDVGAYHELHFLLRGGGSSALRNWVSSYSALIDEVDLRLGRAPVKTAAVRVMRDLLRTESAQIRRHDPVPVGRIRARALRLVQAATAQRSTTGGADALRAELAAVVGAGLGTTPTGDDVVVGVLAGLLSVGHGGVARRIAARLPGFLAGTTRASAHYLSAACRGEFGEHVHDLVNALADPSSVPDALLRARGWGASSGIDLAYGLSAAAALANPAYTAADEPISGPVERIA